MPKDMWGKFFDSPRTRSVTVEQSPRPDGNDGRINVKVEPSNQIEYGIFISINDHFAMRNGDKVQGCGEILQVFEAVHAESVSRSRGIMAQIMEEV